MNGAALKPRLIKSRVFGTPFWSCQYSWSISTTCLPLSSPSKLFFLQKIWNPFHEGKQLCWKNSRTIYMLCTLGLIRINSFSSGKVFLYWTLSSSKEENHGSWISEHQFSKHSSADASERLWFKTDWNTELTRTCKWRISKALKSLFLLKRELKLAVLSESKIYLHQAISNATLMYTSECYEFKRTEVRILESFDKKILTWIYGNRSYQELKTRTNLLPPLYIKVSTDISSRWKQVGLSSVNNAVQGKKFWYESGYQVNIVEKHVDFFETEQLKSSFRRRMWKFFTQT